MVLGGYLSGSRMARNSAKISRHNQCGGPKKAGLAPQGAWMRQGMGNLKLIKSCDSRAANTFCTVRNQSTCRNPYTGAPLCGNSYYDPFTGKRITVSDCKSQPTTKRPATSGGVGGKSWLRFRG